MSNKHSFSPTAQWNEKSFSQFKPSAALNRFLDHLPPNVADSFSKEQLIAIQSVLQRSPHAVDIRLTIPLPWRSFYLILLGGPERRTAARIRAERANSPLWTTANILFATGFISLSLLLLVGLLSFKISVLEQLAPADDYPASIPFKGTRADCENSGRIWQEGECIDYGHSPTF
jgi:hypothetical protein